MTRIRKMVVAAVLALAAGGTLFLIPAPGWVRRYGESAKAQSELYEIGKVVLSHAHKQDGRLGLSFEEWIRDGLIAQQDTYFQNERRDIDLQVSRTLRPIPNTSYPDTLILLVETYEPPLGYVNVLGLDGRAYEVREENIEEIFSRDNARRSECGLVELEIPRVR